MATVVSVGDSGVGIGVVSPLGRGVTVATTTTYRRGGGDDLDEFSSAGGDFVYDPSGVLVGGTITSWKHVDLGNQFLVTDISVPVSSFPFHISQPLYDLIFSGDDSMTGSSQNDHLLGFDGKDTLVGLGSDDYLDGGAGADSMSGGAGDDLYFVDDKNDIVTEAKNQGVDTVTSSISHTLSANVENLILENESAAAIVGTGNELDNSITGTNKANELNGLAGNDTLVGGAGDDILDGGTDFDIMTLSAVAGTTFTLVQSASDTTVDLTALGLGKYTYRNIEGVIGTQGDDSLIGSALNDLLAGHHGNDTLKGAAGNDTLYGGTDFDASVYVDVMDLSAVTGAVNLTLVTSDSDTALDLSAFGLGKDTYRGIEGIIGTNFADTLAGGAANNLFLTGKADDSLSGAGGGDTLDGGAGADTMSGGTGLDTYIVDDAGDVVIEGGAGDVLDTVHSSVDYVLGKNLEWLLLTGTAAINGTGNQAANRVEGNDAGNKLNGLEGADTIVGNGGGDTLDGGAGVDTMYGGAGDDSYYVDDVQDVVSEVAGEGTDTVFSSVGFSIFGAPVENIVLTGDKATFAGGNDFANILVGNDADNVISDLGGNDTVNAAGGNDSIFAGSGNDTIDGGEGIDIVQFDTLSSTGLNLTVGEAGEYFTIDFSAIGFGVDKLKNVEGFIGTFGADTLIGSSGADSLGGGGAGADSLTGNDGNDTLEGGSVMLGGAGADFLKGSGMLADGGEGNDTLQGNFGGLVGFGGAGDDLLSAGDQVSQNGPGGDLSGNDGNDKLIGSAGEDTLDGGDGADTLIGGIGDDLFIQTDADDKLEDISGNNALITNQSLTIGYEFIAFYQFVGDAAVNFKATNSWNFVIGTDFGDTIDGAAFDDTLIGGAGDDLLMGGAHSDVLDGEAGADTLIGGLGDDTYYLADSTDVLIDSGGFDAVVVPVSVDLLTTKFAGIEIVALSGAEALNAAGTGGRNFLIGNGGDNLIDGRGGNDWLIGNDGNDTLNGGAGIDRMEGDLGNDLYYVDNFKDFISEAFGSPADIDSVKSTVSYKLGADLENLELIGALALNGAGNALDNILTGNAAANRLDGGAGADTMSGGGGNDFYAIDVAGDDVVESDGGPMGGIDTIVSKVDYALGDNEERLILDAKGAATAATGNELNNILVGNALSNTLDGGLGIDQMTGGAGNDLYRVDSDGELALESIAGAKGGYDTVESQVSYTLIGNVEQLILLGVGDLDGTGNAIANLVDGNDGLNKLLGGAGNDTLNGGKGDDTLDGGAGNDSMAGGAGDDTYTVNSLGDKIADSGGADTVQTGISLALGADLEDLQLLGKAAINGTGNSGANVITGNGGNNLLTGDLGDDTMLGGVGNDRLFGGAGADNLDGGAGNDVIVGGAGADNIDASLGNDRLFYTNVVDAGDIVTAFDGTAAGGQDQVNLDLLLDSLAIAGKDRVSRVGLIEDGGKVEVRVDADGDAGNGFELLVVTLNTADTITLAPDVVLGA